MVLYNPADMALWGIDPYTGLQTLEPVVPSAEPEGGQPGGMLPPAETGTVPSAGETETPQPPAETAPVLPVPTPIPDPGEAILPPGV